MTHKILKKLNNLFIFTLFIYSALINLACAKNASSQSWSVFASDLGKVYGLGSDTKGNLYATGTVEKKNVVWQIAKDGTKALFSELRNDVDALGMIGLDHSKHLTNLTVDGYNNIWVVSSKHGVCFLVTPDKKMYKVYLNKKYSISLKEKRAPSGVAWDSNKNYLYIITSGPKDKYSTDNIHHLATLKDAARGYKKDLYAGENKAIRFIGNVGIPFKKTAVDLLKTQDSPLYLLDSISLYIVDSGNKIIQIGQSFKNHTLFSGTIVKKNIYISAEDNNKKGIIFNVDSKGKRTIFSDKISQPRGLVYADGFLYVTDNAEGKIFRIQLN